MHNKLTAEAVAHLAEMIKGNIHIVEIKYVGTITMIAFSHVWIRYARAIVLHTHTA